MFWLKIFVSIFIGITSLFVLYLYNKSATFRYIIRHPATIMSLVRLIPISEEKKMERLMNDPELQRMFQNEDIQTEMQTNMKKMQQNKNYREKYKKAK